jgi:hypothetical protein
MRQATSYRRRSLKPVFTAEECLRRAQRLARARGFSAQRLLRVYKRGKPNGYRTKALLVGQKVESVQFAQCLRMYAKVAYVQVRLQRSTVNAVEFCNFYIAVRGHRNEMLRIPAKLLWKQYFEENQKGRATMDIWLENRQNDVGRRRYHI